MFSAFTVKSCDTILRYQHRTNFGFLGDNWQGIGVITALILNTHIAHYLSAKISFALQNVRQLCLLSVEQLA